MLFVTRARFGVCTRKIGRAMSEHQAQYGTRFLWGQELRKNR